MLERRKQRIVDCRRRFRQDARASLDNPCSNTECVSGTNGRWEGTNGDKKIIWSNRRINWTDDKHHINFSVYQWHSENDWLLEMSNRWTTYWRQTGFGLMGHVGILVSYYRHHFSSTLVSQIISIFKLQLRHLPLRTYGIPPTFNFRSR